MEQRGYVAGEGGGENLQEGELGVDKNCSEKKVKKVLNCKLQAMSLATFCKRNKGRYRLAGADWLGRSRKRALRVHCSCIRLGTSLSPSF